MKQGIHAPRLKESLDKADRVYFFRPQELAWDTSSLVDDSLRVYQDTGKIIDDLVADSRPGDNILIMSNGGFENLHQRLLSRLALKFHQGAPM